jgi:hypothetical protein
MIELRARTPRWVIIVIDLLLAAFALGFAYLIRFDLKADVSLIRKEWLILSKSIWFYFLVKFLVFYLFKIHKGLVRYTSTEDLKRIFLAILNCSFIFLIAGFIRYEWMDGYFLFPMSVLILEFLAGFAFAIGFRIIIKVFCIDRTKSIKEENVLTYRVGFSGRITNRTIENEPIKNKIEIQGVSGIGMALVKPFSWVWIDSTSSHWSANFNALEWKYNVTVSPLGKNDSYQINFGIYLGGEVNYEYETNSGDLFKVLATIVDIVKYAIKMRGIKKLIIAPTKEQLNDERRLKLYTAYILWHLPNAEVNIERTTTKFLGKTNVAEVIKVTL